MKVGDFVYFAPGLRFDQVDVEGPGLRLQYRQRMLGLYIEPAEGCAERGEAFAAGVLLVSCVDAFARLRFGGSVGQRFRRFVRGELESFSELRLAQRLYDEFRNGLVHEGRLKNGAQFSLEIESTVFELDGLLLVNPALLASELRAALDIYIAFVERDDGEREKLADHVRRNHVKDFLAAKM